MRRFNHYLDQLERFMVGGLLIMITAILFANVVLRYVFSSNLGWAEELARYSVVWITMIGTSLCVARGSHISVDALSNYLSMRGQKIQQAVVLLLGLLATLVAFYYSLQITLKVTKLGQMSSTLGVPMTYVYGALPVGFGLAALRYANLFVLHVIDTPNKLEDAQ